MPTPAIAPYAALLGLMMIALSFWVSFARRRAGVSLGWGEDPELMRRVRAFGNFAEWVPLALLLLIMAEAAGAPAAAIHFGGAALVIGRVLHPVGLFPHRLVTPLRVAGMVGTYLAILVAAFHLLHGIAGL